MNAVRNSTTASANLFVTMRADVSRRIRQHCRSSMKAEVCGVLIGERRGNRVEVQDCIPGVNAAQGGAHVTFTQDAWEHIYKIKDRDFPDARIIGWYHSHPGFGVFLSEHDEFIQKNFFSSADQIAWVHDPHTDEEGCFGWMKGRIERLREIVLLDEGIDTSKAAAVQPVTDSDEQDSNANKHWAKREGVTEISLATVLSYIAILLLGVVIGGWFGIRRGFEEGADEGLNRGMWAGAIEEYRNHVIEHNPDLLPSELGGPANVKPDGSPSPFPTNENTPLITPPGQRPVTPQPGKRGKTP